MNRHAGFSALLVLAALVSVFLLANATFTWFVERRAEGALESRLGSPADVDLWGWPVAPRLLTGSLAEAPATIEEVRLPG